MDSSLTLNWDQASSIQGNITVQHRAKTVHDSTVHHADGGVEIASDFGASAVEVDHRGTRLGVDIDVDLNLEIGEFSI
jgi:hypothetical protein